MTMDSTILYILSFIDHEEKLILERAQEIYNEMELSFTGVELGLFNESVKDDACRFWQTETISNKGILDYINIKIYKTTGRGKFNHMNYRTIDKAIKANGLNGEKREVLKYHYMDVIDLYKILSEAIRGEGIL